MRKAFVVVLAFVFALPACSKSSGSSVGFTISDVSAGKLAMTGPARVKAGKVELQLTNKGKVTHDAQLVRVEGSHSADEVLAVVNSEGGPIPDWLHGEGGVGSTAPGKSLTATVVLDPGSYYAFDTNSNDNNDSYAKQGAVMPFTVTGTASSATVSADVTISAREYEFTVPTLKSGTTKVKFQNTGKQLHLLVAAQILPGKTFEDVKNSFASQDNSAPPPADFDNAVGFEVVDPGKAEVSTVTLKKGTYAFICFVNDRAGGPPHFTKGMLQQVNVA